MDSQFSSMIQDPQHQYWLAQTRRHFFSTSSMGLGLAALSSLTPGRIQSAQPNGIPDSIRHFAPKAKRAIYLFMAGAPCQMDLLDYKPRMHEFFDKDLPESIRKGQRLTTMTSGQKRFPIAPSKFNFKQYGRSGTYISDLLPYHARMTDDIAVLRGLHTEAINHDPAITYICTGHQLPGRASLGSWLSYGLGAMNQNLPSFVVMTPSWSGRKTAQALYNRLWGSGFLPTKHQGIALRSQGDPVLFLSNPKGISGANRRSMLDHLEALNQITLNKFADPQTQARIDQYELAFKMQSSVPELTDLSNEPDSVLKMYGPDAKKPGAYGASCLLARRLVERDVRFVQIFHRGWDQHGNIANDLPNQARDIDQPSWALVQDLKNRGLLDDTLVIWGGEFGRTIYCQGGLTKENYGRDHHPRCFSMWMAGGGIKPGIVYGETDDFSYNVIKEPIHIHELNATILRQLGIDHTKLTYKFQGLEQRLTGVEEVNPVHQILS